MKFINILLSIILLNFLIFSDSINVTPSQTVNVGQTLTFTLITTDITSTSSTWDFGDGTPTINEVSPSHVYTEPGQYTVTCHHGNSTLSITITVNENRSITVTGSNFKVGDTVNFTANNFITNNLKWDFGDGAIENGNTTKSHIYSRAGNFTVKVYDNNGTARTPVTYTINILPDNRTLNINPNNPALYQEVTFNANGFSGANLSWDFGDGTTLTGSTQVKHTYTRTGNFEVKVNVVGSSLQPIKKTLNINRDIRKIEITPSNIRLGIPISIKVKNIKPDIIVKWKINNTYLTETQQNIRYTFYDSGTYEIICEITGQTPLTKRININNANRRINYSPRTIFNNSEINFEAINFFDNRIKWDFGDGTIITQARKVKHNFRNPGFYNIKVYDFNGKSKKPVQLRVNVISDRRVIKTTTKKSFVDSEIEFRALNFSSSYLKWDFGDGVITNGGTRVKHTYKRPGFFTVKAYDFGGKDNKAIKYKINVVRDNRVLNLPKNIIEGEEYDFSINGTGTNNLKWEIVGMKSAAGNKVKLKFPRSGNYQIRIIDPNNIYPTIKKTITVKSDLRRIHLVKSEVIIKKRFKLSLNRFKGNVKIDFGDGTKKTAVNNSITHIYKKPGKYTIKAIDNNGKSSKVFSLNVIARELSSDFSITTMELKFSDGKYYKVIPIKSMPPDFILRIKATRMGYIRGKWMFDDVTMGLFSEFLQENSILELKGNKTPKIPVNELGLHKIMIEFTNFKYNKKPFLRYFVSIGGGIKTIYPSNGSKVMKDKVMLKWHTTKKKYNYEIAISQIPFHYLKDNQIKWKKAGNKGKYLLNLKNLKKDWVYWQVRKLNNSGRIITTSEINYFKIINK